MKTETIIATIIAVLMTGTTITLLFYNNKKQKELERVNKILLKLAKTPGSGVSLADLSPGTVINQ